MFQLMYLRSFICILLTIQRASDDFGYMEMLLEMKIYRIKDHKNCNF